MANKTASNEVYSGLLESISIPAELHERDGKKFASFGSAVPIHCCTPEEMAEHREKTHHYCGVFTEQLFAPLGELAYVRLDENTAEKVFVNRSKRLLVVSSDGALAQWRAAPSFESHNALAAGAPLADARGALLALLTVRHHHHYAISNFEGDGGYFSTPLPWKTVDIPDGACVYGDRTFATREELREYVAQLPPPDSAPAATGPPQPILYRGKTPRVVLVASDGRQIAHIYLHNVTVDVEYL